MLDVNTSAMEKKKAGEGDGIVGKGCSFISVVRKGLLVKVTSKSRPSGVQREPR